MVLVVLSAKVIQLIGIALVQLDVVLSERRHPVVTGDKRVLLQHGKGILGLEKLVITCEVECVGPENYHFASESKI